MKPKILFVTEASFLSTGYSNFHRNIMLALQSQGIEVEEFALCVNENHPNIDYVPWILYPNLPITQEEQARYNSMPHSEYGSWRFEEVLLKSKPTHVFCASDSWHWEYQTRSPLRKFFSHIGCPAIDNPSQNEQWLQQYQTVDAALCYTEWGCNIMREYGGINVIGKCSPIIGPNYRPIANKKEKQLALGLGEIKVVGMVARNQPRKLFPDLFEMFSMLLKKTGRKDVYLYLHTDAPATWELDREINKYGVGHRTLFTYICTKCNQIEPSFYNGLTKTCGCGGTQCLPNGGISLSEERLSIVYNLMDIYVQMANCLGHNELIYTDNGYKKISDIVIGDKVLTHKNRFMPVLNTFKTPSIAKTVKEISIKSDYDKLIITDEHPVLAYTKKSLGISSKLSIREYFGNLLRNNEKLPEPKFINVSDLSKNDMIVSPVPQSKNINHKIDLLSNIKLSKNIVLDGDNFYYKNTRQKYRHSRYLNISNDISKLIGIFVADGNSSNGIRFTSHENEQYIRDFLIKTLNELGYKTTEKKYNGRLAYDVSVSNIALTNFFKNNCLSGENKKLPDFILNSTDEIQSYALQGLIIGDGHFCKTSNSYIYTTISKKLAEQVKLILKRLRYSFNCNISKKTGKRKNQYRYEIYSNVFDIKHQYSRTKSSRLFVNGNEYNIIKNINVINYDYDYVYNIEVEKDNSYVTKITSVHNCEGFGLPIVEAASCGVIPVSVGYSSMEEVCSRVNGINISPIGVYQEPESGRKMAVPNKEAFVNVISELLSLPSQMLTTKGLKSNLAFAVNYGKSEIEKTIENLKVAISRTKPLLSWNDKSSYLVKSSDSAPASNDLDFAKWLICEVLCEPWRMGTLFEARLVRDLQSGFAPHGFGGLYYNELTAAKLGKDSLQPFNREIAYTHFRGLVDNKNYWEQRRLNVIK